MDIKGSSAIVTGGAGGFGEATVRRLVAMGAKVVIADLSEEKGEALAGELAGDTVFVKTDVTDEASVQAAVDAAVTLAPLRLSVAVHGGPPVGGRTLNKEGLPHSLEDFQKVTGAYLAGAFNVTRLAAAAINQSEPQTDGERGLVVNTASIAGFEGTIGQVAYAAAKGGVIGMTLVLARDLAVSGIRAMTIAPGVFATPAYGAPVEELNKVFGPTVPFPQRMGYADEYAMLVQQMVENPYLNGEVIRIDGALRFSPKWPRG
jgi:NAD(P)-dependent dehydrogenase (short-subunit alcohol dehydrogenase family)